MPDKTGGAAIAQLLDKVNVDERMGQIRDELETARTTKRTALNREIKYLQSLKANGLKPTEAFMVKKLPVVPANMRPVYTDERGTLISSDLNSLYQDVGAVNDQLKNVQDLPDSHKADLRADLYDGVKAVQGLGDPISENKSLKGIFQTIAGAGSPKGGFFQSRVIRSRQNLSGRSTITLGNDLDMDQVGLPEEMAWPLYRDFAVRELVGSGYKKADALEAVKDRSSLAKSALESAMKKRPVWLNRAPSLHRHSIMALDPVLTPGRAIKISPLVTKSYNADFDGDQMAVHVPVTQAAVDETRGRKPSDLLFATGSDKLMMVPSQSSALGLFLMSRIGKGELKGSFKSDQEALKALAKGEVKPEDPIRVEGRGRTTGGRIQINHWLPQDQQEQYDVLDKKGLNNLLKGLAVGRPDEYGKIVQGLRALGDEHATDRGFSIGLEDLQPKRGLRDKVLDRARDDVKHKPTGRTIEEHFTQTYSKASDRIEKDLFASFKDEDNSIGLMMLAGSRGSPAQARQIFASPVIAQDHQGKVVQVPIKNAYADGLDEAEYYSAAFGARAGAVGRSHQTSLPGALAKEVLSSVVDSVVSATKAEGMPSLDLAIDDEADVLNRFVAKAVTGRKGKVLLKKDGLVTPDVVSEARRQGVKKMAVYTPLNAAAPGGGIPAMSYGVNEQGQMPEIGTNVGVLSGHAMTEPISQMTLDSFHSGGTGGTAGRISKFDRIKQLFNLPEDLPGKATLATKPATVRAIKKSPVGGWDLDLDGSNHYVDPQNELRVKEGDSVGQGDALSEGPIKPQELAQLKGIEAAQDYLVREIKKETEVDRRAAEVVVGSMTNHSQVDEADLLDSIIPGDIIPNWKLQQMQRNRKATVELPMAVGRTLTNDVPGFFKAGATLSERDIERLRSGKIEEVEIGLKAPRATAIIKGTNMLPIIKADQDWMAGMGFRRLKDVLGEGALRGRSSDIHSYNPVPALAQGAEFGLGEQGKY